MVPVDTPSSEDADDQSPHSDTDAERRLSQWTGYGLAILFVTVFVIAMFRPFYPIATVLVVGSILLLFSVLVGVLAVQERLREK